MSFGSPTPVEVVVAGPEGATVRGLKVLEEMKKIPSLRDVQLYQQLDYPTVRVDIDREKAGLSGVTAKDVTDARWRGLLPAATWPKTTGETRSPASTIRCRSKSPRSGSRAADRVTSVANLRKAKIDVETWRAEVKVSEADERKAAAMLAYTKVTAPTTVLLRSATPTPATTCRR